jgi:hypothetical protein
MGLVNSFDRRNRVPHNKSRTENMWPKNARLQTRDARMGVVMG